MTTFCVAYKNQTTIQWAKKTGNTLKGWVRISAFDCWDATKRVFTIRTKEFTNSDVAIFSDAEWNQLSEKQVQS